MNPSVMAKAVLLVGLAAWMTVAVVNNASDPGTNHVFVGAMLEMRLLQDDPDGLGRNLLWRAVPAGLASPLLWLIVLVQAGIAAYLWKAGLACAASVLRKDAELPDAARQTALRALTGFMALWLAFMVGGFWFGYWIKQGVIQQVHMTLLIISVLSLHFVGNRANER